MVLKERESSERAKLVLVQDHYLFLGDEVWHEYIPWHVRVWISLSHCAVCAFMLAWRARTHNLFNPISTVGVRTEIGQSVDRGPSVDMNEQRKSQLVPSCSISARFLALYVHSSVFMTADIRR